MKVSFIVPTRPHNFKNDIVKKQFGGLDAGGHQIEIFLVEGFHPPLQRNLAIRKCEGDFVFFFDDDAMIPGDLVSRTLSCFNDHQVAGVGGPNLTPGDDSRFSKLCGEVLSSFFATGSASARWKQGKPNYDATEKELHGSFICFRGDIIRKHLFCEDLFPGDENELINRIRKLGYRFYYIPDCFVYHKRRRNLAAYLKQVFISGRGRAQQTKKEGLAGNLYYLMPLLFGIYLVGALPILFLCHRFLGFWGFWLFPLFIYGALAIFFSLRIVLAKRALFYILLIPLFLISHLTYAAGMLRGLFLLKNRGYLKKNVALHRYVFNGL